MAVVQPLEHDLLIAGADVPATGGDRFPTFDPATGEVIGYVAEARQADVDQAVAVAVAAFGTWRRVTPEQRGLLLLRIADSIRAHADELIALDVHNAGLPLRMARADVETAARYFQYYAGAADKLHGETVPLGPDFVDYTELEPYGVCAIIPPFNVPLQLTARSVAPALATGNTVVVKPAEQAPLPTLSLGQLLQQAGLPAGVVNVVPGMGAEAGAPLVAHPEVAHVTFTGSLPTGRAVLRGAAENCTPVTLELGGKSPQIVFPDADLDAATTAIVGSALLTAGQVCSAGTRILTQRQLHQPLADRLRSAVQAITVGRPAEGADMGPLISRRQQDGVLQALGTAVSEGASVLTGGGRPSDDSLHDGFFVAPTVLDDVRPGMRVAQEEIFGPVVALLPFDDEDEAVALANDSEFGLVAGVWTADVGRAHRVARAVRAGQAYINGYGIGGGVELPFGGYRRSGYGREKGLAALREYTQVKNICVRIKAVKVEASAAGSS